MPVQAANVRRYGLSLTFGTLIVLAACDGGPRLGADDLPPYPHLQGVYPCGSTTCASGEFCVRDYDFGSACDAREPDCEGDLYFNGYYWDEIHYCKRVDVEPDSDDDPCDIMHVCLGNMHEGIDLCDGREVWCVGPF